MENWYLTRCMWLHYVMNVAHRGKKLLTSEALQFCSARKGYNCSQPLGQLALNKWRRSCSPGWSNQGQAAIAMVGALKRAAFLTLGPSFPWAKQVKELCKVTTGDKEAQIWRESVSQRHWASKRRWQILLESGQREGKTHSQITSCRCKIPNFYCSLQRQAIQNWFLIYGKWTRKN